MVFGKMDLFIFFKNQKLKFKNNYFSQNYKITKLQN